MPPAPPKIKRDGLILHDVGDYERYKKVQVVANKLKHDRVFAKQANIHYLRDKFRPYSVLCHGVRNGAEVDYFSQYVPYVMGTDIAPSDHPAVIECDMHDRTSGYFDMVYSNSWDHSYDPERMFRVWASQLYRGGHIVLEHTSLHCPSHASERDPFGATRKELMDLLRKVLGSEWKVWMLNGAPDPHHDLVYIIVERA